MKLYDKKFLIYENCVLRNLVKPGQLEHRLGTI